MILITNATEDRGDIVPIHTYMHTFSNGAVATASVSPYRLAIQWTGSMEDTSADQYRKWCKSIADDYYDRTGTIIHIFSPA